MIAWPPRPWFWSSANAFTIRWMPPAIPGVPGISVSRGIAYGICAGGRSGGGGSSSARAVAPATVAAAAAATTSDGAARGRINRGWP